jgi:hypothetical protein
VLSIDARLCQASFVSQRALHITIHHFAAFAVRAVMLAACFFLPTPDARYSE